MSADVKKAVRALILTVIIILLYGVIATKLHGQTRYSLDCDSELLIISNYIAYKQIGTKELTGKNDGVQIEKYLHSVGLKKGAPYCAAGQYYCFDEGIKILRIVKQDRLKYKIPIPKTGLANGSYNYAKKYGNTTRYIPEVHDLIVWRKNKSWSGHIERIIEVLKGGWVRTIAFNTSNGKRGSQREGNGVFVRKRNIYHPLGRMYVRGLVGFKQKDKVCSN